MITIALWVFGIIAVIWWIDSLNDRGSYSGSGEYCAEPFPKYEQKKPINPLFIRAAVVLALVASIVAGLILGIEWLWFWSGVALFWVLFKKLLTSQSPA
jgi:hypothetical protein